MSRIGGTKTGGIRVLLRTLLGVVSLVCLTPAHGSSLTSATRPALPDWLPPDVRGLLNRTPAYLLNGTLPSNSTIQFSDVDRDEVPTRASRMHSWQNQVRLLEFLRRLPPGGTYYFVGSGMYPAYQAARTLLEGTPLAAQIRFLPVSRLMFREAGTLTPAYERILERDGIPVRSAPPTQAQFAQYFDRLGITPGHAGPIVLIDSISRLSAGADHSLLQLQQAMVAHLIRQGMTREAAMERVVPVGIPERDPANHRDYRVTSLEDYQRRCREIAANAGAFAPYLDLGAALEVSAYNGPRWNGESDRDPRGKYATFGPNGEPAVELDSLSHLFEQRSTNLADYQALIASRRGFIAFYQSLQEQLEAFRRLPTSQTILRDLSAQLARPPICTDVPGRLRPGT